MRRLTIDCSEKAQGLIEEMLHSQETLVGLTLEIFEQNKVMLLSPLFREMMIDRAKLLKSQYEKLHCKGRFYIDAPGIDD